MPLLPRRQDPDDRRGHRRGAADGDRAGAGSVREPGPPAADPPGRVHGATRHDLAAIGLALCTQEEPAATSIARDAELDALCTRRARHLRRRAISLMLLTAAFS